jgi:hypothetical protein
MGRNNNSALSDVINSRLEGASSKRKADMISNENSKPGNLIKDPVKCPLCLTTLMCPRNQDYDTYIDRKLMSCTQSSDKVCKAATSNPKNKSYLEAVKIRVQKNG